MLAETYDDNSEAIPERTLVLNQDDSMGHTDVTRLGQLYDKLVAALLKGDFEE